MQALRKKPHFTSLHGKVGVIALVLVGAAPALGFLSFRKMGLLTRLPAEMQPKVKWAHRLVSFCGGMQGTHARFQTHTAPPRNHAQQLRLLSPAAGRRDLVTGGSGDAARPASLGSH